MYAVDFTRVVNLHIRACVTDGACFSSGIVQSHSSASPHFIASAHSIIQTRSTPEESLAQPTMLLAFCAEGFAL